MEGGALNALSHPPLPPLCPCHVAGGAVQRCNLVFAAAHRIEGARFWERAERGGDKQREGQCEAQGPCMHGQGG